MSTTIQWTDETLNPIRARHLETGRVGWHCTKPSTGCKHCYAESMNQWRGTGLPFVPASRDKIELFLDLTVLDKPLHWKKPRKVFVCDMTDLFQEAVPREWLKGIFGMFLDCPTHIFQVLTKRPQRMRDFCRDVSPPPNVWLGVSVEDQATADERIPILIDTPAAVRFISAEPLLGPVSLKPWISLCRGDLITDEHGQYSEVRHKAANGMRVFTHREAWALHWVIVGGESGSKARPCDIANIRNIVQQCNHAAVPVFVKQLGSQPIYRTGEPFNGPHDLYCNGEKLKDKKGGDVREFPEDLQVREYPA